MIVRKMLSIRKIIAIYCFLTGTAIIAFWIILILTNQVLELSDDSIAIYFHLSAEFLTSIMLITSGIGLSLGSNWANKITPISLGMLLYATINAIGPYAEKGDLQMLTTFLLTIIFTLAIIIIYFRQM